MISTTGTGTQASSSTPPITGNSNHKAQDERDMAMITSPDMTIYATERYYCKSSFLVALLNKFGEQGGFDSLLRML